MKDTVNAFVAPVEIDGRSGGPLDGLTFCAKDIYDVADHVTGRGNPDWAASHGPAEAHATPVARLLDAGARLVAKSHTDEFAYSLMGVNAHYGTPVNPAAPDRVPGGSSSGSVAAVAAGLVDIGLGSDTGGSVRIPASFCGVWGLRTTHGAIPMTGTMPLAPSFDTVGWFTRDGRTMERVADALALPPADDGPRRLLLPVDVWAAAEAGTVDAIAPVLARLEAAHGAAIPVVLAPEGLGEWFDTFRICQAAEVWQAHGAWVESAQPAFGPGIADRFRMAAGISADAWAEARAARARIRERITSVMDSDSILVLPSSPGPAPQLEADETTLDAFRGRALKILCTAGLASLPQLSVPAGEVAGAPVGLSLAGAPGRDRALIAVARHALQP